MKRYGFKFYKGDPGDSEFDDLRAFVIFLAFMGTTFEVILYTNMTRYATTSIAIGYVGLTFLYITLSMLAEISPKIGLALVTLTGLALAFKIQLMEFIKTGIINWQSINFVESAFHLLLCFAGGYLLYRKITVNKARQNRPTGGTR